MAQTIASSRTDAGNTAGTQAAACSDWRAVSRFHVGKGHTEPTQDAGYTTARNSNQPQLSIGFLAIGGSIYDGLAPVLQEQRRSSMQTERLAHDYHRARPIRKPARFLRPISNRISVRFDWLG